MKVKDLEHNQKFKYGGREYIAGCYTQFSRCCNYVHDGVEYEVYIGCNEDVDKEMVMLSSLRRGDKFRFDVSDTVYEYLGTTSSQCGLPRVVYSILGNYSVIINQDALVIPAH